MSNYFPNPKETYENFLVHSDILYHHGILGQKWGIRRFQNKDGSLTDAGKKHYSGSTEIRNKGSLKDITMVRKLERKVRADQETELELERYLDALNRVESHERVFLTNSRNKVHVKAPKGEYMSVQGKDLYHVGGKPQLQTHIVDDSGKVRLSYMKGEFGDIYTSPSRKDLESVDLKKYFKKAPSIDKIHFEDED